LIILLIWLSTGGLTIYCLQNFLATQAFPTRTILTLAVLVVYYRGMIIGVPLGIDNRSQKAMPIFFRKHHPNEPHLSIWLLIAPIYAHPGFFFFLQEVDNPALSCPG
jgi:hypothetical protein